MRVLLTTPTYPPFNSGLGNAVQQQAKALLAQGVDVVVATGGEQRGQRSASANGVIIEEFPIKGAASFLGPITGDTTSYLDFLKQNAFDVIIMHAWQNWATDLILPKLNTIPGKKYLYSHGISTNLFMRPQPIRSFIRYLAWRPYWWKLKQYMKKLDGIIFLANQGDGSRFDDLNIARKIKARFHIIPNSLSEDAVETLLKPGADISARNQLICVGSYQWQKGFDFVLRAYAKSSALNKFPLIFFGQEHTKFSETLKQLVSQLSIDPSYVSFRIGVSGISLLEEYNKSILCLSGSHTECQPLILLDANATGTPFIARKTGCIATMPGGVAVQSIAQASQQIDTLLSHQAVWNDLHVAGRKAATNHYHPDHTTAALMRVLQSEGI